MSQTQLHGTISSELAGRRRWPLIGLGLFTLSFLLVIYYVVGVVVFGANYFYRWNPLTADVQYTLWVVAEMLAVPLAAMLAGVGAAIVVRIPSWRLWLMIGVLVLALAAPLTAGIFVNIMQLGLSASFPPLVFGVGGVLIITSVLLTCWFWAQERPKLRPAQRLGADLRLIAYVLFGFAAFWTCGLASQAVIFGSRQLDLAGLLYSIMADLVLGWGFLLTGHLLASRAAGRGEAEHVGSLD